MAEPLLKVPMSARFGLVLLGVGISSAAFLLAGVLKLADLPGFYQSILNYSILGPGAARLLAFYLPWLEIVAALAILTPTFRRAAAQLLFGLLVLFSLLTLYAWIVGLPPDCGCFGGLTSRFTSHAQHLLLNGALLLAAFLAALKR